MTCRKTPIAVFAYNRPEHTRELLLSLSKCARLDECSVHIFCDGPKRLDHMPGVKALRRLVREWATILDAELVERARNLGLAQSIVAGVTDLCQRHGQVIVLEDDQVVSPDFLDYMLEALDRYQDWPNVYQISGYMFRVEHPAKPDAFFLPLTTTWGWGTWDRAWRIFDWNATGSSELLADRQIRRQFNLDNAYPYAEMLEQRLAGENDSWGILFWWAVFQARGLVLHPRQSFIWVGGFDDSGTHCGEEPDFMQQRKVVMRTRLSHPPVFPEEAMVDEAAFERVKTILRSNNSLIARARRKKRRYIRVLTRGMD